MERKRTDINAVSHCVLTIFAAMALLFLPLHVPAQTSLQADSLDENFVIASIIITDPGLHLYSRLGHVAIRMQCPEHNLDYIFSYESEDASRKVLSFLAGRLHMGLAAISTEEYLNYYREDKRGVMEYTLNLPIAAKQNLWRILDNHAMEGMMLPYDYINRGCAYGAFKLLEEGLLPGRIEFTEWPETFNLTRRELSQLRMKDSPWAKCFMELITNGSIDSQVSKKEKVIMPADLLTVLSKARYNGQELLSDTPAILVQSEFVLHRTWCTPLLVSILILVLTVFCCIYKFKFIDYPLLVIQTLLGLVTCYLIFFSNLCCTEWSWLIIPFNIFPAIFWHWRQFWMKPYGAIILIWVVVLAIWPHKLTDSAYLLLATSIGINYLIGKRL